MNRSFANHKQPPTENLVKRSNLHASRSERQICVARGRERKTFVSIVVGPKEVSGWAAAGSKSIQHVEEWTRQGGLVTGVTEAARRTSVARQARDGRYRRGQAELRWGWAIVPGGPPRCQAQRAAKEFGGEGGDLPFACVVGDRRFWVCDPYPVHDPNGGMCRCFGYLLLMIA